MPAIARVRLARNGPTLRQCKASPNCGFRFCAEAIEFVVTVTTKIKENAANDFNKFIFFVCDPRLLNSHKHLKSFSPNVNYREQMLKTNKARFRRLYLKIEWNFGNLLSLLLLPLPAFHIQAADFSVTSGNSGDVILRFLKRRNLSAVFDDRVFARIVSGEREPHVSVKFI